MTRIADRNGFFIGSQTFRAAADAFVDQKTTERQMELFAQQQAKDNSFPLFLICSIFSSATI